MPYDPSDLRLPPWLLRAMERMVRFDLRLGVWRFGLTRPGALFLVTLFGVSAAAVYSGNNLLYLCGAMFASFGAAALISGMRLLHRLPPLSPLMPGHTLAGVGHVLREAISVRYPFAALIDIAWQGDSDPSLRLGLRLDSGTALLGGCMLSQQRGILRFNRLLLESSAPLGLWRLGVVRDEAWEWVAAPAPVAIHEGYAAARRMAELSGDEWRDLRAYVPGDMRSRIHWRKLPLPADPGQWLVKRFAAPPQEAVASLLRVDLRLPEGASPAALDRLLGQAVSWLMQEAAREPDSRRLVIGHVACDPASADVWRLLAIASPETRPPTGEGGLLLSLVGPA